MSKIFIFNILLFLLCAGCQRIDVDESLLKGYQDNNRIEKYYKLKDKYENNTLIMFINTKEDHPIMNWTIEKFSWILPDLPDMCAAGGIVAIIYFVAWWIGVTLCGGGILAVLAFIGASLGAFPGIPPAIMGIIYLGLMFSILIKVFDLLL